MKKQQNLKIIPLGGLDEIGKNLTAFEMGNEIIMVVTLCLTRFCIISSFI